MRYRYYPRHAVPTPFTRGRTLIWVIVTFTWPAVALSRVVAHPRPGDVISDAGAAVTCGLAVAGRVVVRLSWRRLRAPVLAAAVADDARRARRDAAYLRRRIAGYDAMWSAVGQDGQRPSLTVLPGGKGQ